MRLLIVRHGEAVAEILDPKRPLTPRGISEVEEIGQFLKAEGVRIDVFVHSPKDRARQTAEILQKIVNPEAVLKERDDINPNDSPDGLLSDLRRWTHNTAIVGHLPFLGEFLARLTGTRTRTRTIVAFPTAGMVMLENDEEQKWHITSFVTPDQLRSI